MKFIKIFLLIKSSQLINFLLTLSRLNKRISVIVLDIFIILFSIWASISIRLGTLFNPIGKEAIIFIVAAILGPLIFLQSEFYKVIIRFINQKHILQIVRATIILTICWVLVIKYILPNYFEIEIIFFPRSVPFIFFILTAFLLIMSRVSAQYVLNISNIKKYLLNKVVIYGTGVKARGTYNSLINNNKISLIGFLDSRKDLHGQSVYGYKVFGDLDKIPEIKLKHKSFTILIIDPDITQKNRLKIINKCEEYNISVRHIPVIDDLVNGMAFLNMIQDISPSQLLGRPELVTKTKFALDSNFNKCILVTGAGGSIGSELCRQLMQLSPLSITLVDSSEYNLYCIKEELQSIVKKNQLKISLNFILGSVENSFYIEKIIINNNINSIYHAAAYKHVSLVEKNPISSIYNNIFGTLNIVKLASKHNVSNLVLVSTDKAVRPSTLMGKTKRISELIVQSIYEDFKNKQSGAFKKRFSIVRFGNVLESSGSVIPIFKKQITNGGPVTVTDKEVSRYFMTIQEASQLVIEASGIAIGGEVFVLDMGEPVKIDQLAKKLIRLSGYNVYNELNEIDNNFRSIKIEYIGLGAEEKLHEELIIGKKIHKTKVSRIFKAEETFTNWLVLKKDLDRLEKMILNNEKQQALKIIDEMLICDEN